MSPDISVLSWVVEHRTGWATKVSSLLTSAGTSVPALGALALVAALWVVIGATGRWASWSGRRLCPQWSSPQC